ncbi:type ISP restriction/modification enzyme [Umezakia ovalisporum]|uniref:type ISP restriction/modification enzyme n=1 Tax=Umezakia ovalisporum TaxID=75695 RepID=UPI002474F8BC|nr:type ISP restriction/modification enzyme [Umezakia ovalisporum]MDH6084152.1 helicase [Umezakia ovalisporum TAC611]
MKQAKIYYAAIDDTWTKEQRLAYLEKLEHTGNVEWQEITPDKNHNWLTNELKLDYHEFLPIGNKEIKSTSANTSAIFSLYSLGISTNRDNWVYSYQVEDLIKNINVLVETYNQQVFKWKTSAKSEQNIDSFVLYDDEKIKWSSKLKQLLNAGVSTEFNLANIRIALYRPFTSQYVYFDQVLIDRRGKFPVIFPTVETEAENRVICLPGVGNRKDFGVSISRFILSLDFAFEKAQCFPFYTYNEDGTNRQENITHWALSTYRHHYQDTTITKWDIFYYIYAVLHHPHYRERYAANLKKELPRIPYAPEFHSFVTAGKRLAEIHINYEKQPQYPLKHLENKDLPIDWLVEKMRLCKDKTQIKYNDFLTLTGIPPEVFNYRLGNRSALDWIIDQYQVKTDKLSGITNNPNRLDDEQYIVRLVKQIITVSLETVKIVEELPDLGLLNI